MLSGRICLVRWLLLCRLVLPSDATLGPAGQTGRAALRQARRNDTTRVGYTPQASRYVRSVLRKENMRKGLTLVLAVLLGFGLSTVAFAQGSQTVVLSGTVRSSDGLALPGVTVNLKSPALQGVRSTTSDAAGAYQFKGLPSGEYTVSFLLTGMATIEQKVTIEVGTTGRADATMQIATVQETVVVTGEAPSALTTPQVVTNFTKQEVDRLPIGRTPFAMAELSPNLSDNTPNAGQVTIAGGFAYDNVFLLDGVDINDNLFANANALFIEDAIESQAVLTGAISAEYGRFLGGVINTVTKRGGNTFSGSFRTDFTNPKWTDFT